jgi:NADP-dependent 3-hydroxy acid dehydrogenase YdfG
MMMMIPFELIGQITAFIVVCKLLSSFYYRLILQPKHPLSYGKWVIITGSTAGIGKEYADHCASLGMSIFLISRSEDKLKEQQKELINDHKGTNVEVRYLAYDFTDMGLARAKFYEALDKACVQMDKEGE